MANNRGTYEYNNQCSSSKDSNFKLQLTRLFFSTIEIHLSKIYFYFIEKKIEVDLK